MLKQQKTITANLRQTVVIGILPGCQKKLNAACFVSYQNWTRRCVLGVAEIGYLCCTRSIRLFASFDNVGITSFGFICLLVSWMFCLNLFMC